MTASNPNIEIRHHVAPTDEGRRRRPDFPAKRAQPLDLGHATA